MDIEYVVICQEVEKKERKKLIELESDQSIWEKGTKMMSI